MVDNRTKVVEWVRAETTQTVHTVRDRCVSHWLGELHRRSGNQWALGQVNGSPTFELSGTCCSVPGVKVIPKRHSREGSYSVVGQYYILQHALIWIIWVDPSHLWQGWHKLCGHYRLDIKLRVHYYPGRMNIQADQLLILKSKYEWKLNPKVFSFIDGLCDAA